MVQSFWPLNKLIIHVILIPLHCQQFKMSCTSFLLPHLLHLPTQGKVIGESGRCMELNNHTAEDGLQGTVREAKHMSSDKDVDDSYVNQHTDYTLDSPSVTNSNTSVYIPQALSNMRLDPCTFTIQRLLFYFVLKTRLSPSLKHFHLTPWEKLNITMRLS